MRCLLREEKYTNVNEMKEDLNWIAKKGSATQCLNLYT